MRPVLVAIVALLGLPSFAARADDKPVSFHNDVRPILTASCNGCHKADKKKGGLDMTSYAALRKGGKHGDPVVPGDVEKSSIVTMISGPEPEMPDEGDPLVKAQVDLITRWVKQGAKDDTPAAGAAKVETPVYHALPVITSLAYSPDGSLLAVNGYSEVVLHKSDGSEIVGRLVGEAPRIEALAFSKDGKQLALCGGAPAEFGSVQVWDVGDKKLLHAYRIGDDSLYGLSFAPDGKSVACGAADKTVRQVELSDGKITLEFKAHSDWVLGTAYTLDGKRIVSGGRDKAIKLIDVGTGRFVDDVNNPLEQVISMARHPKEEQVLYGGELGTPRLYKISDNQQRTAGRNDTNLVKAFERQPGPASAVAFSPDGALVAVGSVGEVRVYENNKDAKRVATLSGHQGPVFAIAFKPDGSQIATGGFDGKVRLFDAKTGNLVKEFAPVPIEAQASVNATGDPKAATAR
jgi:WD40 repeat protein